GKKLNVMHQPRFHHLMVEAYAGLVEVGLTARQKDLLSKYLPESLKVTQYKDEGFESALAYLRVAERSAYNQSQNGKYIELQEFYSKIERALAIAMYAPLSSAQQNYLQYTVPQLEIPPIEER
ncbi:MAG: hypothetical protein KW793_02505, partial [Candidatus Doudnabacteria bacterium]|nr:hypothetical protein [Candidatus Doudnabacteria bacterium]